MFKANMKDATLSEFNDVIKQAVRSESEDNMCDFREVCYFNKDNLLIARKVEQERYDECESYGWETEYLISTRLK